MSHSQYFLQNTGHRFPLRDRVRDYTKLQEGPPRLLLLVPL